MTAPFAAGDPCLLVDARNRKYLLDLAPGRQFQYHAGVLAHEEIIGIVPGSVLRSSGGSRLTALRPRLADFVLNMKRGAQIVYPKDIGPIVHWADIRPGDTVVEAGTGSGALTLGLLRAVGPTGRVISVEARDDHLEHARKVIARFHGDIPENLTLVLGRVEDVLRELDPDRVVLDLPEPWEVVDIAGERLAADGIFCSYLPTVPQVQHLHDALRRSGRFAVVEAFETMIRDWKFEGRSVRPASLMVGHTGFLTIAQRSQPQSDEPEPDEEIRVREAEDPA